MFSFSLFTSLLSVFSRVQRSKSATSQMLSLVLLFGGIPAGRSIVSWKKLRPCSSFRVRQRGATSRQGEWLQRRRLYGAWRTSYRRQEESPSWSVKGKYLVLLVQLKAPGIFRRAGRHLDGLDCVETRSHNCDYTIVPGEF